jgi:hypothetical protein
MGKQIRGISFGFMEATAIVSVFERRAARLWPRPLLGLTSRKGSERTLAALRNQRNQTVALSPAQRIPCGKSTYLRLKENQMLICAWRT